jgi:hypothetical protein
MGFRLQASGFRRSTLVSVLGACGLIALGACAARHTATHEPGGVPPVTEPAPSAFVRGDAGPGEGGGSLVASFRTGMARVSAERFVSKGHAGGRWEAEVWADDAGAAALHAGDAPVPVGARFLEDHYERTADGGGAPGPVMMMEKRAPGFDKAHGDWRYVVVGARGDLVKDGVVESCAGCHGDAPGDHLFAVDR